MRPWHVVLVATLAYLGVVLANHGGDPYAFVRLGHGPNEGYDGQFTYLIAVNPAPADVAWEIGAVRSDVPAYRYQRILLPILARLVGLGDPRWIVWAIPLINVVAQVLAAALLTRLLASWRVNVWHTLIYGLWVGLLLGVRADLTEPLSFALVIAAYAVHASGRGWISALLFGLAVFSKETAALFVVAQLAWAIVHRQWKHVAGLVLLAVMPYAFWQWIVRAWFGEIGLDSGGYLGTPFEIIPFNGLWRIAGDSLGLFAVFAIMFGPSIVLPALWGLVASLRELRRRHFSPYVFALAVNALVLPFTPFSTFREPGGILRFATGLVLSTLLFAASTRSHSVLRRCWFWQVLVVFLRE